MLAKRWGSHNLIDLSESVLLKLLADENLLETLGQIENFRNLREDASKILASSQKVREAKTKAVSDKEPEDPEVAEERKRKREQVMTLRKKLLKFIQTIPVSCTSQTTTKRRSSTSWSRSTRSCLNESQASRSRISNGCPKLGSSSLTA